MKKIRNILLAMPIVLMLVNIYLIFLVAPTDINLGHIQRIFYLHVPTALLSFSISVCMSKGVDTS